MTHAALFAKIGVDIAEKEPQEELEKRNIYEGGRDYLFSLFLLQYRLTIFETLNIYGNNRAFSTCAVNKQPTNQDNVYERSNHIPTDRELSTDGGVHVLLCNAVLTNDI